MKVKNLELSTTEQFIILDLMGKNLIKNKKVKVGNSKIYSIASIFIDLCFKDKIAFNENQQVIITNSELTGIEYNDIVLKTIASKKTMSIKEWIEYFYSHPKLRDSIYNAITQSIIKKDVLEVISSPSLLNSSKKSYIDSKNIGDFIVQKLRAELLEDGNIDDNTLSLVILLDENKMLMSYFSEYEYKDIKDRIEKMYEDKATNKFKIIKKAITNIEAFSALTLITDIIAGLL